MIKNLKNIVFTIVLSILSSVPYSYAQSLNEITDFKLNSEQKVSEVSSISTPKTERFSGEFNLSLGSQMLDYQNTSKVFSSEAKHIETGFNGFNTNIKFDDSNLNPENQKDFSSIITLNSSYENNAIGFGETSTPVLSLSAKSGKLSFYGKYNQNNLSIGAGDTPVTNNGVMTSVRTSSTNNTNISQEDNQTSTAISSDYYLEAVYSFKPNIKGKVAYKKTVIDAFDLKENVEVEGIVDVTNDVSIKASYQNESRPDLENKNSGEKKVLTEFILKF